MPPSPRRSLPNPNYARMHSEPFEELCRSGRLQPLSPVGLALHEMRAYGEVAASDLVECFGDDPALRELVVQLANAGRARGTSQVASLQGAIDRLGPSSVHSIGLAFSIALGNRAGLCESFDYDGFWAASLARAVGAQVMSQELSTAPPTQAFTCAILSEIGRLAFASVHPQEYSGLLGLCPAPSDDELLRIERGLFGLDHAEATLGMLDHYGFSEEYSQAIASANAYAKGPKRGELPKALPGLLVASRELARILLEELAAARHSWFDLVELRRRLGLDRESFNAMGDRIAEEWGEWGDLLRIPTKPLPSFSELGPDEAGETVELESLVRLTSSTSAAQPVDEVVRILAVDDDPFTLRLIASTLEVNGHQVITATNGREALRSALHNDPHMVVADWMMPEMDGIELCKALRRFDAGKRIFFMLLTGRDEEDRMVEAFEAGVDDFIAKPFRHKQLLARVRAGQRVVALQRQVEHDKRLLREHLTERSKLTRRLRSATFTDVLTELPNRRYAIKRLSEEWANSDRDGRPLSVIMLDIDRFKRINDEYGHDVGDVVLRETARVLDAQTREGESACRLGGEEFVVICANGDMESATQCGERIRRAVEQNIIYAEGFARSVEVSVGVAVRSPQVEDVDRLLKLADEAVYAAKRRGRNQVVRWGVDMESGATEALEG